MTPQHVPIAITCRVLNCSSLARADHLCRHHHNLVRHHGRCDRCGAHPDYLQGCGVCGQSLCSDCYAPWTALSCAGCRLAAGGEL